MFSGFFDTARAFFLGFAMLARHSVSSTFGRHKNNLLCGLFLLVYYSVQFFSFAYHGKVAPKEHLPDTMSLFFQLALAPVLYAGFYRVVLFMSREDVQHALSSAVAAVVRSVRLCGHGIARAATGLTRMLGAFARFLGRGLAFLHHWSCVLGAEAGRRLAKGASVTGYRLFAWSITAVAVAGHGVSLLRRFGSQCVEAGQSVKS